MSIKTQDNDILISIDPESISSPLFDDTISKKYPQAFAVSILPTILNSYIKKDSNDNRLKSRIVFDWVRQTDYTYARLDKSHFIESSGKLAWGFKEVNKEISFSSFVAGNTWFETYGELDTTKKLRHISRDTVRRLREFSALSEDWDTYGAKKISLSTIVKSISFFYDLVSRCPRIPQPFVSPLPDGGINFEWETCSRSLTHLIPENAEDTIIYVKVDRFAVPIERQSGEVNTLKEVAELVLHWIGGRDVNEYQHNS